jgi:CheY-like chemotaxis protein
MKKLSFLLADDDSDDCEFFQQAMDELSPDAVLKIVNDGRTAIEYLDTCHDDLLPCALILDYNMPLLNGPGVLDWLCGKPRFNGIDKFIWSTAGQPEYIDGCLGKGAIKYFVKPSNDSGTLEIAREIISFCIPEPIL